MPPCKCGKRVERCQPKVQCFICKQLSHASCCNFTADEIVFVENSFKCDDCLKGRRLSLAEPRTIGEPMAADVELNTSAASCAGDDNAAVAMDAAVAEVATGALEAAGAVDATDALTKSVIGVAPVHPSDVGTTLLNQRPNSAIYATGGVPDNVTLPMLYNGLLVIRKSNEQLAELVSSLCEEKRKLISTVDELKSAVQRLESSVKYMNNADSSPKRKNTTNNLTMLFLLSLLSQPCHIPILVVLMLLPL